MNGRNRGAGAAARRAPPPSPIVGPGQGTKIALGLAIDDEPVLLGPSVLAVRGALGRRRGVYERAVGRAGAGPELALACREAARRDAGDGRRREARAVLLNIGGAEARGLDVVAGRGQRALLVGVRGVSAEPEGA